MARTRFYSNRTQSDLWDEYCGFLNLNIDQYMVVQNRLLVEQMGMWCDSPLGKLILDGKNPKTIEDFRRDVPLTTYEDYADVLLNRKTDMLPAPAETWIETTWEGGRHPVKVAPYTKGIMDTFRHHARAIILLSSSRGWGDFILGKNVLSGLAPMPFLTGLMGVVVEEEFGFEFMPPRETTVTMGFSERSKLGFKQGLANGVDYFFGMGSISYFLSKQLCAKGSGGGSGAKGLPASALLRMARAKMRAKREHREMMPKDIFDVKGFICAGTDNACYKDDLEELWGIRPMEIFAGTECSIVGTETWNRRDLYFFPDSCYYEFLPLECVKRNDRHMPTLTMDQVEPGGIYELVISVFKGGAFARYRMGDMYRCVGVGDSADHSKLPRFRYIDRISSVIDIAGFTRITEASINEVIEMSRLPISNWSASKEMDKATRHPYLHMYVEMEPGQTIDTALGGEVLRRHLEVYFTYQDSDYDSLKKILGMEPLRITFVRSGTFEEYEKLTGKAIEKVNPPRREIISLLARHDGERVWGS